MNKESHISRCLWSCTLRKYDSLCILLFWFIVVCRWLVMLQHWGYFFIMALLTSPILVQQAKTWISQSQVNRKVAVISLHTWEKSCWKIYSLKMRNLCFLLTTSWAYHQIQIAVIMMDQQQMLAITILLRLDWVRLFVFRFLSFFLFPILNFFPVSWSCRNALISCMTSLEVYFNVS